MKMTVHPHFPNLRRTLRLCSPCATVHTTRLAAGHAAGDVQGEHTVHARISVALIVEWLAVSLLFPPRTLAFTAMFNQMSVGL